MFPELTVALDWLFDRITLDSKIQIKYIDTKNQLADILTKGNFTREEWNHLLCLFNISHFSSINSLEAMSKRTEEDAGEERVTANSKPMMNLVSRYRVRDPNVLASTASESLVKTKSASQNVSLSSLTVQQTRTERPVLGASSSNYSEWNIDDKWSSQVWKSGELSNTSTGRPENDKFVIDDDMDSDNFPPRSRPFLNWVNGRLRKMLDRSQEDAMQDIDKRSMIWWMFMSSTLEASVLMVKNYSEQFTFHQKYSGKSHFKEDVRDIWKVCIGTIRWDFWSVSNQLGKFSMESIIFGQWWRSHQSLVRIFRFCVMPWKDEREPTIKLCMGRQTDVVQNFIRIQSFGQNGWGANSSGIFSQDSPHCSLSVKSNSSCQNWA